MQLSVHKKLEVKNEFLRVNVEAFTPDLSVHVCITVHTHRKGVFSLILGFHHHDSPLFGGID